MRAMQTSHHLSLEGAAPRWVSTALPPPAAGEVQLAVAYAGLNRADLFQLEGSYPAPKHLSNVPGLEVSGTVLACGEGVSQFVAGQPVCALLGAGGYATQLNVPAQHCLPVPPAMNLQQAACLPEAMTTSWMALWHEAALQPGESVLFHGGMGGVGHLALQMLRYRDHPVWATVGSEDKAKACAALGALPIRYRQADFVAVLREAGGVDVVIDCVGGDYIDRSLRCLKPGGRLITLAFLQGKQIELDAGRLLVKQLRWSGVTLRARSDAEKAAFLQKIQQNFWPALESGQISPHIDSIYPAERWQEAHEKMRNYLHCGKILLQLGHHE